MKLIINLIHIANRYNKLTPCFLNFILLATLFIQV